jgi:hypothetical protein
LKKNRFDITQESPELQGFYGALRLGDKESQAQCVDQLKGLLKWKAAYPKSLTATIALANWYMDYAEAGNVTPPRIDGRLDDEGEMTQEKTCMDKATDALKEGMSGTVDDPQFYVAWLKICKAQGSPRQEAEWFFYKGVGIAKEYVPLYIAMTDYLMPYEHAEVEPEKSMKTWANRFPGPRGDALYGYLLREDATNYPWPQFFSVPNLDYGRGKNGLLARVSGTNPEKWRDEHILLSLAMMKGDNLIAKRMLLELEGNFDMDQFAGRKKDYERLRIVCGEKAALGGAESLERAGKVEEAEGRWLSFTTDPEHYVPLEFFYEREGMKDKLLGMKVTIVGKTAKELSEVDPGYAPADILGEAASYYAMMGEWDKGEVAAQRFDVLRPENMIGKNVLLMCAIGKGDAGLVEKAVKAIAGMKTKRPPYRAAREVLSGGKGWNDVAGGMRNNNQYLGQGVTAIALYYLARGDVAQERKVIDDELPYCAENSGKALLESLDYGALSRMVKPVALLAAPPATPTAVPVTTGTNGAAGPVTTGTKGAGQ